MKKTSDGKVSWNFCVYMYMLWKNFKNTLKALIIK